MANKTGFAIAITAFIGSGVSIDSQLATLTAVKAAQEKATSRR